MGPVEVRPWDEGDAPINQLNRGTGSPHPNIRDFIIWNTTRYDLGPMKRGQGFEPAQYPQGLEITRPMGDKLWYDFRELPRDTWVRPSDNQGYELPVEFYLEDLRGAGDIAVYYKWLKG